VGRRHTPRDGKVPAIDHPLSVPTQCDCKKILTGI
jgi:hypothetical protein